MEISITVRMDSERHKALKKYLKRKANLYCSVHLNGFPSAAKVYSRDNRLFMVAIQCWAAIYRNFSLGLSRCHYQGCII